MAIDLGIGHQSIFVRISLAMFGFHFLRCVFSPKKLCFHHGLYGNTLFFPDFMGGIGEYFVGKNGMCIYIYTYVYIYISSPLSMVLGHCSQPAAG